MYTIRTLTSAVFASHLISSRLNRAMFSAKHCSSSTNSTLCVCSKREVVRQSKPRECNVYEDQPANQTRIPCGKKRNQKTSPQPDRLQMHVKTNNIFICLEETFQISS